MEKPARLFTLYAKEDEPFVEQLTTYLSLVRRKGIVKDYYDKEISPVQTWDEQTRMNFLDSNCLVFLVSPSLLASGYYQEPEIQKAFNLPEQDRKAIIPVLIRQCDFSNDPLSQFEQLPANGPPVESVLWGDRENAWKAVIDGLRAFITGETPGITSSDYTNRSLLQVPAKRSGMSWPMQLLFSIVALVTMAAITYFVVNYEPKKNEIAVVNPPNVPDSNHISSDTQVVSAPVEPLEKGEERIIQKPNTTSKASRVKHDPAKTTKDTAPKEVPDTVVKTVTLPPPSKAPSINSTQLEQMLFDFSQGKVAEGDFSAFLCNQLETPVRFDKKAMTFQQMCDAIKMVKPKKIKKITVVSTNYHNSCISELEVDLRKKGLFN